MCNGCTADKGKSSILNKYKEKNTTHTQIFLCYCVSWMQGYSKYVGLMDAHGRRKPVCKRVAPTSSLDTIVSDHIRVVFYLNCPCFFFFFCHHQDRSCEHFSTQENGGACGESAGTGNNNRDIQRTTQRLMGVTFHYCNHRSTVM